MTVPYEDVKHVYNTNGSTTRFYFKFKIFEDSDLLVTLKDNDTGNITTLTLNTDYTVNGAGDNDGGYIDTVSTYSTGYKIILRPNVPYTQDTDYTDTDAFPAETHESALDRLCIQIKQIVEQIERTIKFDESQEEEVVLNTEQDGYMYISGSNITTRDEITTVDYDGSITRGLDSAKSSNPSQGDIYIAEDTKRIYHCFANGIWDYGLNFSEITTSGAIAANGNITTSGNITISGSINFGSSLLLNGSAFVLDEDDMASDSATQPPSQQSVKAYIDNNAGSRLLFGSWTTIDTHVTSGTGASLTPGTTYQANTDIRVKFTAEASTSDAWAVIYVKSSSSFADGDIEATVSLDSAGDKAGITAFVPKDYYFKVDRDTSWTNQTVYTQTVSIGN